MTIHKISILELYEIGIKKKYFVLFLIFLFILLSLVHISFQETKFQQKITFPLSSNVDDELVNSISRSGNKLNPQEFYFSNQGNNFQHKYSIRYFRNYFNESSELVFIIESENLHELKILVNTYLINLKELFNSEKKNDTKLCATTNVDNFFLSSIDIKKINLSKILFLDILIGFFSLLLVLLIQILLNNKNSNLN